MSRPSALVPAADPPEILAFRARTQPDKPIVPSLKQYLQANLAAVERLREVYLDETILVGFINAAVGKQVSAEDLRKALNSVRRGLRKKGPLVRMPRAKKRTTGTLHGTIIAPVKHELAPITTADAGNVSDLTVLLEGDDE